MNTRRVQSAHSSSGLTKQLQNNRSFQTLRNNRSFLKKTQANSIVASAIKQSPTRPHTVTARVILTSMEWRCEVQRLHGCQCKIHLYNECGIREPRKTQYVTTKKEFIKQTKNIKQKQQNKVAMYNICSQIATTDDACLIVNCV